MCAVCVCVCTAYLEMGELLHFVQNASKHSTCEQLSISTAAHTHAHPNQLYASIQTDTCMWLHIVLFGSTTCTRREKGFSALLACIVYSILWATFFHLRKLQIVTGRYYVGSCLYFERRSQSFVFLKRGWSMQPGKNICHCCREHTFRPNAACACDYV